MTKNVLESLQVIFRDVLDSPELMLNPETAASDVPGWDSLAHLSLVDAVETEFQVKFALGELQKLRNVGDMIELISQKQS